MNSSETMAQKPDFCQADEKTLQLVQNIGNLSVCSQKYDIGPWTKNQDMVYKSILQEHQYAFKNSQNRRSYQIFNFLSELLNFRRSGSQCKRHHIGMKKMTENGTPRQIIKYLEKKYSQKSKKQNLKERKVGKDNNLLSVTPLKNVQVKKEQKKDKTVFIQSPQSPQDTFPIQVCILKKTIHVKVKIDLGMINYW